ncbi:hypothetical protein [Bariatricus sp. SGI.019]|uniref:hypothetical protein n=1 Tax=Bariatricus sp. SGI.019 TaxID=3420548 RepID=UPI003D02327C
MDRYTARMTQHGTTQRERIVNRLKTNLNNKLQDNPSYKTVKLNGEETNLIINTSTKPYYKEFQSLPDQKILAGDYVEWADSMWLVLNADSDDEVYTDGNLRQCQHCIYWQKSDGTIVSRYAYTENASAYNNGEAGNHTITLQSNQFMVYLPYDEETAELDNGKRVHMSRSNSKCKPYELTRPDDVTYGFGKKGVLNIIFTQTQYNQGNDKLITLEDGTQAWICDYIDSSSTPTPPQPSNPDETEDLWNMKINCPNLEIKPTGYPKTLTAILYNTKTGEIIPDIVYEWNIQSDISEFISYTFVDNVLKISLSKEYGDFGDEIAITCSSKYTGQQKTIVITTKGVF